MAFLFQDQNQGTRNETPRAKRAGSIATALFHPDFNRRPRIHTESADASSLGSFLELKPKNWKTPRVGLGDLTLTAGAEFCPARRRSAALPGNPKGTMSTVRAHLKRL